MFTITHDNPAILSPVSPAVEGTQAGVDEEKDEKEDDFLQVVLDVGLREMSARARGLHLWSNGRAEEPDLLYWLIE